MLHKFVILDGGPEIECQKCGKAADRSRFELVEECPARLVCAWHAACDQNPKEAHRFKWVKVEM
ncbi:hypothetical protein [Streptomyces antimicrobicus]|uniref:Uncharacterized protein n=1 Tax=Streptomyces antimicrobicus TaxID=2883108 RepID=A0ABS8B4J8_9ACTN|nr:hypothetical protein [Streptomyces antimicrobicus]MCB5179528.1 hypothetical protein [Streptomyces antimicrobicus]